MTAPDGTGIPGSRSTPQTAGQAAYEAHRDALGGNRPWNDVRQPEREVWEATGQAPIDWWHADRDLEPPQAIAAAAPAGTVGRKLVIAQNALRRIDRTRRTAVDLLALWNIAEEALDRITEIDLAAPAGTAAPASAVAALRQIAGAGTLEDAHEMADEALEAIAPDTCRTCGGSGTLDVPDSDGESASEQACPDCEPQPVPATADPFGVTSGFRLITDTSGTRHLVDAGGVRYLTEERHGFWELAIRSGNWAAIEQLASNILGTDAAAIENSGMEPF